MLWGISILYLDYTRRGHNTEAIGSKIYPHPNRRLLQQPPLLTHPHPHAHTHTHHHHHLSPFLPAAVSSLCLGGLFCVTVIIVARSAEIILGPDYSWGKVRAVNASPSFLTALPLVVFGFQVRRRELWCSAKVCTHQVPRCGARHCARLA